MTYDLPRLNPPPQVSPQFLDSPRPDVPFRVPVGLPLPISSLAIQRSIVELLALNKALSFTELSIAIFPDAPEQENTDAMLRMAIASLFDERTLILNIDFPSFYSLTAGRAK
jgi:hypothetical protein